VLQIKESDVEKSEIKRHMWVFVNTTVDNPTFSSPTRDALTTPPEIFGSSCELTEMFICNGM
jgi:DNA topoisomerase-2